MAGGGGSSGGQTTTNTIDTRFNNLIDYATQTAGRVNSAGYTPYTGQRFAGLNSDQNTALGMIRDQAQNNTLTNAASGNLQQMMGGGSNPYLDAMVNKAQGNVLANANTAAIRSGSFGNSGIADAAARQMSDVATSMYGNAYAQDQNNRLQAIGMAPTINQAGFQNAGQLLNAGQILQNQDQQGKDFAYQQFSEQQNLPYKQMAAYGGLLGNSGANSTTTTSGGGGK